MREAVLDIGETVQLNVDENLEIVGSLIKHIFFRKFRDSYLDILPLSFYPFRILSRKKSDDLLYSYLPKDLKTVIAFRKQVEIHFRQILIEKITNFCAIVCLRYRWVFSRSCQQLIKEGFNVDGLDVLDTEPISGLEGVLAPVETLIGRILTHNTNSAEVETAEGKQTFHLNNLFLHKSKANLSHYLSWIIGKEETEKVFKAIKEDDVLRLDGRRQFDEIQQIANQIASLEYVNKDGFTFNIDKKSDIPDNSLSLLRPTFNFDYTPGKTHNVADIGLNQYGPYDSSTFDNKKPKILVVCHERNRGGFSAFLDKFKNGISQSGYFKKGFRQKYDLHDLNFSIREINNYNYDSYKSVIDTYIKQENKVDLALIETKDEFRTLPPQESPYYCIKAHLLGLGIPVQFIKNEKVRDTDENLQFLCNTIGLQIYSKLGGTPWVLPASRGVDREIIVGVGSSTIRRLPFRKTEQERIVGITTFFSGDGDYLLSNKCREVPYDEYFNELLASLEGSIKEISSEYGWQDGDTVRIVFHIFKTIKNVESDVVSELITRFNQYDIKYAFVTISSYHPFLIFDTSHKQIKGRYVPDRGVNLILDDDSCLLQLIGPKQQKTRYHRFSNPVLIKIHPNSTFRDLHFITQQIYFFTSISLRGFLAIQIPVTLYYSNLIAGLLGKMRKVPEWNPLVVNTILKKKKWFL